MAHKIVGDVEISGTIDWSIDQSKTIHVSENGDDNSGVGSERDPYATVTKALTALASSGITIIRIHGTVTETSEINLDDTSNIFIVGDGMHASIITNATATTTLSWQADTSDISNVGISDLTIENTTNDASSQAFVFGSTSATDKMEYAFLRNIMAKGRGGTAGIAWIRVPDNDDGIGFIVENVHGSWINSVATASTSYCIRVTGQGDLDESAPYVRELVLHDLPNNHTGTVYGIYINGCTAEGVYARSTRLIPNQLSGILNVVGIDDSFVTYVNVDIEVASTAQTAISGVEITGQAHVSDVHSKVFRQITDLSLTRTRLQAIRIVGSNHTIEYVYGRVHLQVQASLSTSLVWGDGADDHCCGVFINISNGELFGPIFGEFYVEVISGATGSLTWDDTDNDTSGCGVFIEEPDTWFGVITGTLHVDDGSASGVVDNMAAVKMNVDSSDATFSELNSHVKSFSTAGSVTGTNGPMFCRFTSPGSSFRIHKGSFTSGPDFVPDEAIRGGGTGGPLDIVRPYVGALSFSGCGAGTDANVTASTDASAGTI